MSANQVTETVPEKRPRKRRRVKRKKGEEKLFESISFDIPGIVKIILSPDTQGELECVVWDDVTPEDPWKHIPKELVDKHLLLYDQNSEFFPFKEDFKTLELTHFLMGYIPDMKRGYDEFYMCITESAERKALDVIDLIKQREKERVNGAVYKTAQPWRSHGSEEVVDQLTIRNNRPLLEVEVESQYPILSPVCYFKQRFTENARDGYAEWVPGRRTFTNAVWRKIDAAIQVAPMIRSSEAQTTCTYPQNAWTQYEYEYNPILKFSNQLKQNIKSFIDHRMDQIEDTIYVTSYINFYKNDYADLVKEYKYARQQDLWTYKEYTSIIDIVLCKGKMISSMSWHPLWSGTIAVAYAVEAQNLYRKQKPNEDEVLAAIFDIPPVILWSFTDSLHPKLVMETPREITTISFCPFLDNILVGGAVNGQVIIWDISNKLERVETEQILTPAQQRYRALMEVLTVWMKNTNDLRIVRCTAAADLQHCHKSAVSSIKWISPFQKITKTGQIKDVSEFENKTSLQFMTISKDGSILCWDLNSPGTTGARTIRKFRRLKACPSALISDVSPIKSLHRILKPTFRINVLAPGTSRNLPLTSFNSRVNLCNYEEVNPDPKRKFNFSERIYFKAILTRPTYPRQNEIQLGSTEGDFIIASWEGFSFNSGETVNKENAKLENCSKYHDGPVVSMYKSNLADDLLLTVGGRVFALWRTNFVGRPFLWRRSKHKYTSGIWNTHRPSLFSLTRDDGFIEIWNLNTRSDRYEEEAPVSCGPLIRIAGHKHPLKHKLIAAADSNGRLRIFYLSQRLSNNIPEDNQGVLHICEREVDRKLKISKWQEDWKVKHAEWIRIKKEYEQRMQEQKEEEIKRQKELLYEQEQREREEAMRQPTLERPEPGKFKEWAERQWRAKEEDRMNRVLLQKKALDFEFLEKQQVPLKLAIAEEHKKRMKQEQRLNDASRLFNNTVAMLFPDVTERKPFPPPDPYAGGDPLDVKIAHYQTYLETERKSQEFVDKNKYVCPFEWHKIIQRGKERRKFLHGCYSKPQRKKRPLDDNQHFVAEIQQQQTETNVTSEVSDEDPEILSI